MVDVSDNGFKPVSVNSDGRACLDDGTGIVLAEC